MPQEGYASAEYTLHQIWKLLNGGSTSPPSSGSLLAFQERGAPNFSTGQATVGAAAGIIVAGRATRRAILIINGGTTDVYIGAAGVTTGTGVLLTGTEGAGISIPTTGALYAICSGSQSISWIEVYD